MGTEALAVDGAGTSSGSRGARVERAFSTVPGEVAPLVARKLGVR